MVHGAARGRHDADIDESTLLRLGARSVRMAVWLPASACALVLLSVDSPGPGPLAPPLKDTGLDARQFAVVNS